MSSNKQENVAIPRPASNAERENGANFFCLRFQVWYPSVDCAYRTRYQTFSGCENCDQGRFNARRHPLALKQRWCPPTREDSPSNAMG